MKIAHYFEFADRITGGIEESVKNQRKILDLLDVQYTTEPTLDVDIFHCNLLGPRSVFHAKRANSSDIPVVAHTHVTAEDFGQSFRCANALSKPLRPYLQWAYGHADELVCPSEYNRRVIETYVDVPTSVISNGIDRQKLHGYESLTTSVRDRYGLESPVVFLVGHVIKRKGLETFVETARLMPDVDFAWFGPIDRPLKGRPTRALIDDAPDNCTFTGYVDDIRDAYAAGDVFFFPTREENEGIALMEAMGCGKPVVVRNIETFEWLQDERDCLKVSGAEPERFREALDRLRDPDLRHRLGRNAAARIDEFSLESLTERYRSLYERVSR